MASTSSSSSDPPRPPPPWLDLPDFVTDLILERLPLVDYIRFAAVCPKWLSIQRAHRLHHSPGPPPMRQSLPWVLPFPLYDEDPILCVSMSDSALLSFPPPSSLHFGNHFSSSHGWIFISKPHPQCDSTIYIFLFNPISGRQIQLPSISSPSSLDPTFGLLSASPSDPNCIALLAIPVLPSVDAIFICRMLENHLKWTEVKTPSNYLAETTSSIIIRRRANVVFCRGKFIFLIHRFVAVVDPLFPAPSMQLLEMDCSQLPEPQGQLPFLVESYAEVLLVLGMLNFGKYKYKHHKKDYFQVFRAEFSKSMWVRLKQCGDRMLFVGDRHSFSLSAAEVGFKNNCICYTDEESSMYERDELPPPAWRLFDLDSGVCSYGPPLPAELAKSHCRLFQRWFLPSLC